MNSAAKHLNNRLLRCLKPWDEKTDGQYIRIGTLRNAFPSIAASSWFASLADTSASGFGHRNRIGLAGRTRAHEVVILTCDLAKWLKEQDPSLDDDRASRLVTRLLLTEKERHQEVLHSRLMGIKQKQATSSKKPRKPTGAPKITSDALFTAWGSP